MLPSEVVGYVPEAKHYTQLREAENALDRITKAKKLDLEEMVVQPSPTVKTMLLLHIYNTHYNQQNAFTLTSEEIKVPAWCLRIEGKVLLGNIQDSEVLSTIQPYIKMTHYIRKIEVAFDKEQVDYPHIEWNQDTSASGLKSSEDKDGIEIIREGNKELDLTISIHINHSPEQFKARPELFSLIGIRQCTRTQAIAALWEYIKANRLQDQQDRKVINCNKELKVVCLDALIL